MIIKQTFKIKGMHCASCANTIEKSLKKIAGVESVEVNYGTETAKISFDDQSVDVEKLSKEIEKFGYSFILPKQNHQMMKDMKHDMSNIKHSPTAKEMNMSEDEHAVHLGLNQSKIEKLAELKDLRNKIISALPLAVFSIFVMIWEILAELKIVSMMPDVWSSFIRQIMPIMATYILFVVGKPYLLGFYRFLRYGKANMDSLIGIGTSVAFIFSFIISAFEESLRPYINVEQSYYEVTIIVITFIALGKYLETRSKLKTGDAIEKLLNLQAKTALVVREGREMEISIDEVAHGDIVVIKPSGKIPVDGVIVEGQSYVDESMITGEPMPISKKIGDTVVSGTINTSGTFTFKATKVGSETMLAGIIKMVEEAQSSKAPIQALADKISSVFVPAVLIISIIAFVLWLLFGTAYLGFSQALSYGLVSFVSILIIACPCALGLATPTAIIVGVGKGAREGILIKDAGTLEKLHKANIIVVDKTGTLTIGKPEVVSIQNLSNKNDNEIISILATLENKSEHPIAHAIVSHAINNNINLLKVDNFEAIKGKGVKGNINGVNYFAGNIKLIQDLKLQFDIKTIEKQTNEGKTPILLATKDAIIGTIMVADAVKPEAVNAVKNLHQLGIKVVMLTGDNKNTASFIAKQLGIDDFFAEVMPDDKLNKIKEFQSQGNVVAMAGDGVNDAPALAQADIGIAMATGTDVAIESAGITLLHGDISKIVKAVRLSKLTMRGIKQNLFWAFFYNIVGIPLASGIFFPIFGWLLNPIFAGIAMALSSVSVVGNSLRIKTKKL